MSCTSSKNVICKHVRSDKTYYVDLDNQLPSGVTVVSVSAEPEDVTITVEAVTVLEVNTTVESPNGCPVNLLAGRAILIRISAGTPSDEEVMVTVEWTQSDGDTDARDLRLIITGNE